MHEDASRTAALLSRGFLIVAALEALSWAALLVSMWLKHVGGVEGATRIPGAIHGFVFIAYVVSLLQLHRYLRLPGRVLLWGLAASVPPFTTAVFEYLAVRAGHIPPGGRRAERGKADAGASRPA